MLRVGLTSGAGADTSTVASRLAARGAVFTGAYGEDKMPWISAALAVAEAWAARTGWAP